MTKELVGTGKAAEILGVSKSTVYRMLDQNILAPIKTPGGQRRFSVQQLMLFKENSVNITAPQNPSLAGSKPVRDINKPADRRNTLNDLNGTLWLPLTKSFFFQKGLGVSHPHAQIERLHPAPFSFQDISQLVIFFTKKGMQVLDPFGGVGSTAKACELEGRFCTSIELQKQWNELAKKRLDLEIAPGVSKRHKFIEGDSVKILPKMPSSSYDFIVTSPPYWAILNKKADHKIKKTRLAQDLQTSYSDDTADLGNIAEYGLFLDTLVDKVFMECARVLKSKKYMCLVVSDFRNKSEFVSFHSDIISRLNGRQTTDKRKITLQGTKVLIQNHKILLPYGYPFAYVENIHHQYVLIFRKD